MCTNRLLRASAPLREVMWVLITLCWLMPSAAVAAQPGLRVVQGADGKPAAVEALGLSSNQLTKWAKAPGDSPDWVSLMGVYVKKSSGGDEVPGLAGRYQVIGEAVRFAPRYPFVPGLKYHAEFTLPAEVPGGHSQYFGLDIDVPALPPSEPTRVTAIYPSGSVLPENQLRFYLHFSKPMRQGEAYTHVKLLKPDGQVDKRAFLEIGEELWDTSGTRLTLLFDPGRVKQGLKPREEFGPVLEVGKSYSIAVDKAWRDADGQPLAATFEKKFTAGPAVEMGIEPAKWKITPPSASTRGSLVVRFPRPLDKALLKWTINLEGPDGKPISGDEKVADEERQWEFTPEHAWGTGKYALVVDTTLEDTAGNKVGQAFEVDVFEKVERRVVAEYVRVPFSISAQK